MTFVPVISTTDGRWNMTASRVYNGDGTPLPVTQLRSTCGRMFRTIYSIDGLVKRYNTRGMIAKMKELGFEVI